MPNNILTEAVIRIRTNAGRQEVFSLPEVFTALMQDQVDAFPALRPHQRHAWHAFLVQLGAMAMHRAGLTEPPQDAAEWLHIIRALTPDWPDDEPWQLVVDDITKPAFMQPPASDWTSYGKKELFQSPDALDMLDTAKNHDMKTTVGIDAKEDDWIYSLITMQTMNGQVGRGNYPIARMNSGDGSRAAFSITSSLRPGLHLRRDMTVLLKQPVEFADQIPSCWDGLGLLWTKRWDGKKSEALLLSELNPFYIEICRRRRLCVDSVERLYALKASSDGRRIAAAENRGIVGDPWTLVDRRDQKGIKALTLPNGGFTYRRVTEYLTSGDWETPVLARPTNLERTESVVHLAMRGVRRKKGGQTEGYHERTIPVRAKFKTAMLRRDGNLEDLGSIAQKRIEQIATVQRILSHAIQTFLAGGDSGNSSPEQRKLAAPWLNRLDAMIDASFFDALQTEFEADDAAERERIRNQWLMNDRDGVVDHARRILQDAAEGLPCPAIHRYRARVNAEGLFEGRLRGNQGLPFLFDEKGDEDVNESAHP